MKTTSLLSSLSLVILAAACGSDDSQTSAAGTGGSATETGGQGGDGTGGDTSAAGGTGGATSATGGATSATGGATSATGGATSATGGAGGDDGGAGATATGGGDGADGGDGRAACPEGYTGAACQDCAEGFVAGDGGTCVGACEAFDCSGHGTCSLDPNQRPVCGCDPEWTGAACDTCAPGYEAVNRAGFPPGCRLDVPATTGMLLWLDADDETTFQLATGNAVFQWHSRVPGDSTFFGDGGMASARPVRTLSRTGRSWVTFDGVDDRLRRLVDLRSSTYSIFVVARAAADVATQTILSGVGETTMTRGLLLQAKQSAADLFFRHSMPSAGGNYDDTTVPGFATADGPTVIEVNRVQLNLPGYQVWNGTDYTTTAGITDAHDEQLLLQLGLRADSGTFPLEGSIGEVIVFAPAIATAQRKAVREYLAAKWR